MADLVLEAVLADHAAPVPEAPVPAFVAVQRVCVRMLFDPAFAAQVGDDPQRALAGLGLPAALVAQLASNDRRLWHADRLRRARALKVLMEEFRVSTALALFETRKLAFLDAFFGSPEFHAAVQRRGYMALAFASYLHAAMDSGPLRSPRLRAVLALETAMARSRRLAREAKRLRHDHAPPLAPDVVAARPGVLSLLVPAGTIGVIQAMERYLFESSLVPALALCDDAPRPGNLPDVDPAHSEAFLLEPGAAGKVDLNGIPLSFHRFLEACTPPARRPDLQRRLGSLGMTEEDLREMEDALREAGVLRPLPESS